MLDHDEIAEAIAYNRSHPVAPAQAAALVAAWHGAEAYSPADPGQLALLVAAWQAAHGLIEDGKYGPQTAKSVTAGQPAPAPPPPATHVFTGDEVADRMMAAAAHVVFYDLGSGGSIHSPNWPTWPWDGESQCDCSAAARWAEGKPRNQGNWNTDKILRDAVIVTESNRDGVALSIKRGAQTQYRLVEIGELIHRGDVFVFGGKFENGVRKSPGHVGIGCTIPKDMRVLNHDNVGVGHVTGLVIGHCSPGNSRRLGAGHAIALTPPDAGGFHHRGYVLRGIDR